MYWSFHPNAHLNPQIPHVLEWIGLEIKLSFNPIHFNTHGLRWIQLHPNKSKVGKKHTVYDFEGLVKQWEFLHCLLLVYDCFFFPWGKGVGVLPVMVVRFGAGQVYNATVLKLR
jgi:hypothetical protein